MSPASLAEMNCDSAGSVKIQWKRRFVVFDDWASLSATRVALKDVA
jgi:hypothetical protein